MMSTGSVSTLSNDGFDPGLELSNGSMKSYVISGIIVTIPSNMTEQMRQDILCASLFTQVVADYNSSRNTQFQQWLENLGIIGDYVGWSGSSFHMGNLKINESQFVLSDLALHEMAKTPMRRNLASFKELFNGLKNRSGSDKALKLLAKNAYDRNTHDTTMVFGSVSESVSDHNPVISTLVLSLTGVKDASSRPLFHPYEKKGVKKIVRLFAEFKQYEKLFALVRKNVTNQLGDLLKTEISEIF